jgi:hypothetical protein
MSALATRVVMQHCRSVDILSIGLDEPLAVTCLRGATEMKNPWSQTRGGTAQIGGGFFVTRNGSS